MKKAKKHHPIRRGVILFLLFYLAAFTVPYIEHKAVPEEFKSTFLPESVYGTEVGSERVAYIEDNLQALLMRFRMVEEAKEEVILSTFDFRADQSGREVMAVLMRAAERGVQVRILIDGFSGFLSVRGDPYFLALARHENIQIRIYNPVDFLKPWKMQARLHDKYLIIDHKMYLLGGRNTYDLFLGAYSPTPNIDCELFVLEEKETSDSSLEQVRNYFEQIWALSDCEDFVCERETEKVRSCMKELSDSYDQLKVNYPSAWESQDWQALTMETYKITLLSNPIEACNKEPLMWYSLIQLMKMGNHVTIFTPYIICGKEMYEDLEEVCKSVSELEIITNDVTGGANPWGCADYQNQKKRIWSTGVQVYEYLSGYSSHTKAMVVDDRLSVVGSYNMDMRSTYQDTELMLAVDCPQLNELIRSQAQEAKTYSRTMMDGEYQIGENYHPAEANLKKSIFQGFLRVMTLPIRRFL